MILWIFFYFNSILKVPFHPDEATQIYMSEDLELIFNNTSELFFQKNPSEPLKQNYRLLDAPITRYLIGTFRVLFDYEPISDWDWSQSWQENNQSLPENNLLLVSRVSVAIFFPLSIILFFLILKDLFGSNFWLIGLGTILFSLNSLLLLHTRRAMAESPMIFFMLLSLLILIKIPKKFLFLSSIPISLAINAKQLLIFLVPVAILLIFYLYWKQKKLIIPQVFLFLTILVGFFILLNPISWKNPTTTIIKMIERRSELSTNQISTIQSVTPDFVTDSFPAKLAAYIGQVFILEPIPQEVSNYDQELKNSIDEYFKNPFHKGILRNLIIGSLFLLITIFGVIKSISSDFNHQKLILISGFLFFTVEILFSLILPFQRYYLPAIPFSIIFTLIGLHHISIIFMKNEQFQKNLIKTIQ